MMMTIGKIGMVLLQVGNLLSSCMDANRLGCQAIRDYCQSQLQQQQVGDEVAWAQNAQLKESGDVRSVVTQADYDSQKAIISSLQTTWGSKLHIIGEEEDDDDVDTNEQQRIMDLAMGRGITEDDKQHMLLNLNLLDDDDMMLDHEIPIEEIEIWVDPLDATREFVEGRLENVAVLVGISHEGRTIGGTIGRPFPQRHGSTEPLVYFAYNHHPQQDKQNNKSRAGKWWTSKTKPQELFDNDNDKLSKQSLAILAGDSKDLALQTANQQAMEIATRLLQEQDKDDVLPELKLVGGTASKLLTAVLDGNAVAICNFKSSQWDTCSPQALVQATGGYVTDFFGNELIHRDDDSSLSNNKSRYKNTLGVIASSGQQPLARQVHEELCKTMSQLCEITRATKDGNPVVRYIGQEEGKSWSSSSSLSSSIN